MTAAEHRAKSHKWFAEAASYLRLARVEWVDGHDKDAFGMELQTLFLIARARRHLRAARWIEREERRERYLAELPARARVCDCYQMGPDCCTGRCHNRRWS